MEIEKTIPNEILMNIIGFIATPEGWNKPGPDVNLNDLRHARLVCRRWHSIASNDMFPNIALLHTPDGEDFTEFEKLTSNPTVQDAARRAQIYSGPHHYPRCFADDRNCETWAPWEVSGDWRVSPTCLWSASQRTSNVNIMLYYNEPLIEVACLDRRHVFSIMLGDYKYVIE